jgi:hypothetical protein
VGRLLEHRVPLFRKANASNWRRRSSKPVTSTPAM